MSDARSMVESHINLNINRKEALDMLRHMPLIELGRLAFDSKRARYGNIITFVRNRHVNPTNLCVNRCAFCGFSAKPGDPHAYVLDESRILADLEDAALREVHVVGGLHPEWNFARSLELIRSMRLQRPDLWIKAFTAVEVAYFARSEGHGDPERILGALQEAGVDQLPGGGAEVLSDRVHRQLCPGKLAPAAWLEIHRQAHRMGLPSNATLLFGHIETDEEIVDHLFDLHTLQEEAPGFQSFVPLAYQPENSGLALRPVSATKALRVVALARLVLDMIPHVKAYWPSLHLETAAAALNFGADDLDGTLGQERVMHLGGSDMPQQLDRKDMESLVRHAGQRLAERDGAFRLVEPAEPVKAGA